MKTDNLLERFKELNEAPSLTQYPILIRQASKIGPILKQTCLVLKTAQAK